MRKTVFQSHSESDTEDLARRLAPRIAPGTVLAFTGGMGMGKTAFTRGFARGLGLGDCVSSPTFALVNDYGGSPRLCHFDMYRVHSWDDLYSTGFFDYLDGETILLIEWSENIENALPENTVRIDISPGEGESDRRIVIYEPDGEEESG